jgi:hypothetical protein
MICAMSVSFGQTTNQPLTVVLHRLNWVLRGWAN